MPDVDELSGLQDFSKQTALMALKAMGLAPRADGNLIDVGAEGLKARCVVLSGKSSDHSATIDLGVELFVSGNIQTQVRTTATCSGRSPEEAVLQAVQVIIESGLPPVLKALDLGQAKPRFSGRTTTRDGSRSVVWEAFEGEIQVAGRDRALLSAELDSRPPLSFLGSPQAFGQGPLAWVCLSAYRREGQTMLAECTINSHPWAQGTELLTGLRFPPSKGFLFMRQFCCVRARLE